MTEPASQIPALPAEFEKILMKVQGPGQYVGCEPNIIIKPEAEVRLRVALSFPDTYSVGMSHHGLRILYDIINRRSGWAGERVYTPLPDMEKELRASGLKWFTLESRTPLSDCDVLGFSVSYELTATNMLTLLDLGGVPLLREERGAGQPIVIAGGHGVFNPEPLSDFIDLFIIGEGEEALPRALELIEEAGGRKCADREALLRKIAAEVEGAYVPSFYRTETNADGFEVPQPVDENMKPVRRAIVHDFESLPLPRKPIVPVFQTVHERVVIEVMRGCPNGCRFCQAGFIVRPVREHSVEKIVKAAKDCYRNTGYDEIGLLSLSTSNYSHFDELVEKLDRYFAPLKVSLSLPSLRVDHALSGIPEKFKTVRKSGFTIAPEAGTDRLRAVINKDVANENLIAAAEEAYAQGWQSIKLYFMVGLPTETDEDVAAIPELANRIARLRRSGQKKKPAVTLSVSNYVPKAHTPFQWEAMGRPEEFTRKGRIISELVDRKRVSYKHHDVEISALEGVMSRGDRKLGRVILNAWQNGARLDGWDEYFRPAIWAKAFDECGIDMLAYASAERGEENALPWSCVDMGYSTEFLRRERERSRKGERTPMCAPGQCAGCGISPCSIQAS
ncbi:MAG: TIGR03960 family B12-binding radical SAM protein [Planctomycetes bacterium]|nr:TIGR03960 family B12-binding radical SAM protein [Planctomycetota bacterium]